MKTFQEELEIAQRKLQLQLAHDKRVFKKTGRMSNLMIRIESFNRGIR